MESMRIDCIIDAVSKDSWPMAYENIGDFVINDDSTITVDSQTLTYAEIQDVMRQIAERVFNPSVQHLEHAIAGFIDEIRALRNPVLEKILTWLVFPIIVGLILCIIGPIADHYIKEYLSKDKKQLTKRIKKNVVESVKDAELLKKYRLVSIKTLNVRLKPSSKSSVLGKLNFGQPIIVIGKKGEWSQIVWSDDENMLQGWVFSKYLSKLQ